METQKIIIETLHPKGFKSVKQHPGLIGHSSQKRRTKTIDEQLKKGLGLNPKK